jgi:hypothetical protein
MSIILKHKEKSEVKGRILDCFYAYCNARFGSWDKFMENDEFRLMMEFYEPKYGSAVFSTIADIVAETEHIEIKDLLADFSNFINKN